MMNRILNLAKGNCPVCEQGQVFQTRGSILRLQAPIMNERCTCCNHRFESESGYFVGAMYVSYALAVGESIAIFPFLYLLGATIPVMLTVIITTIVLMSMFNYRYSRIIWLYIFNSKVEGVACTESQLNPA